MAKYERKVLAHYLDASFTIASSPTHSWFLIGKDIEEMSVELNPDTETVKNILGETSVKDNGYEPTMSAEPYYANPDDSIYDKIKDIAMQRLKGDACKTYILEVIYDPDEAQETTPAFEAYREEVIVKPQSYGGDTSGVQIPYEVLFDGNRTPGTVSLSSTGVPTFTPA